MTVSQIIEQLKNYPSDLRVVVSGYEGGYNDVDIVQKISIVTDLHTEWYYGKHETADGVYGQNAEELKKTAVDALRIG